MNVPPVAVGDLSPTPETNVNYAPPLVYSASAAA
jgi:hypothetical protein